MLGENLKGGAACPKIERWKRVAIHEWPMCWQVLGYTYH